MRSCRKINNVKGRSVRAQYFSSPILPGCPSRGSFVWIYCDAYVIGKGVIFADGESPVQ